MAISPVETSSYSIIPSPTAHPTSPPGDPLKALIIEALDALKAEDITAIDLHDKASFADTMIIASGTSQRHIGSIADKILRLLKEQGLKSLHAEGLPSSDWVLIDAGDVVIHLFRPETRRFYNLEKLWSGAWSLGA